jgi:hypothetical protein
MKRYLISFDDDAMTFPEEDGPAVAEAAHAVFREATDAGPRVCGAARRPAPRSRFYPGRASGRQRRTLRTCSSET